LLAVMNTAFTWFDVAYDFMGLALEVFYAMASKFPID